MYKFKIGDIVRVKFSQHNTYCSSNSKLLSGKIGKVTYVGDAYRYSSLRIEKFVHLDIEKSLLSARGLWIDEIELIERKKRIVREFGIVKFMRETS